MNVSVDQYMSVIRSIMSIAGGALVTSGAISGSTMESLSGIMIPVASIIWGLVVHTPENTVKRADEIKASKGVV